MSQWAFFDRSQGQRDRRQNVRGTPSAKWADRIERRVQNYDRQGGRSMRSRPWAPRTRRKCCWAVHVSHRSFDHRSRRERFCVSGDLARGCAGDRAGSGLLAGKAESLAWPMKLMKELVGEAEYVEECFFTLALGLGHRVREVRRAEACRSWRSLGGTAKPARIVAEVEALFGGRERTGPLSRGGDDARAGRRRGGAGASSTPAAHRGERARALADRRGAGGPGSGQSTARNGTRPARLFRGRSRSTTPKGVW